MIVNEGILEGITPIEIVDGILTIPENVQTIKKIPDYAKNMLKKVIIPGTVKIIGKNAFHIVSS